MATTARQFSVKLNAGTATFFTDLHAASGKLREFGATGVSEARATSAAMKTLEGNFLNNKRAADAFIEAVLGGGPLMKAAFPVVGAVAFGGILAEVTTKAYGFFKRVQEAPEKIEGAFRALQAPLRLTNDELAVTNARLENDIAKLEGRHENTLKLALAEARAEADRLAESLDKDVAGVDKLLREQNVSFMRRLLGEAGTEDLQRLIGGETGAGGFAGKKAAIEDEGRERIDAAKTQAEAAAARAEMERRLQELYSKLLGQIDGLLKTAVEMQTRRNQALDAGFTLGNVQAVSANPDQTARIEQLRGVRRAIAAESAFVPANAEKDKLTGQKEKDEADKANAAIGRPFQERMAALGIQIDAVREKMRVLWQPEEAQLAVKAFADAAKQIEEIDKAAKAAGKSPLTNTQKDQLRAKEAELAGFEAEEARASRETASTTSAEEKVRQLDLVTAAVGRGYEATRRANIESRVMQEQGAQYGRDPEAAERLRTSFGREFDAEHGKQSAEAIDRLGDQIELEGKLAGVQAQGADIVRKATFAIQLRQAAERRATAEEIAGRMKLFELEGENKAAADVAKVNEKIAATQRLTAAITQGAEATRRARLENELAAIAREGDPDGKKAEAARGLDAAEHASAVATAAAQADRVQKLDDEIRLRKEAQEAVGKTLGLEIELRDLENQRIEELVRESLALGGMRDGVRAFFLEMQKDAKTTAQTIYDALNSAVDRSSGNLARAMTGQKTEWSQMFREIGTTMVQSEVKGLLQKELAAAGKKWFGLDVGGPKPDGTEGNPIWVRMAQAAATGQGPGSGADPLSLGRLFGGGSVGHMIFSFLGRAMGGSGGGGGESVSSAIDYGGPMADGGGVDPGVAYKINESGDSEYFIPGRAGTVRPASGGAGANGDVHLHYHIDARGADLGAHNRIMRGIELAHHASVGAAVQVSAERAKRTPQG